MTQFFIILCDEKTIQQYHYIINLSLNTSTININNASIIILNKTHPKNLFLNKRINCIFKIKTYRHTSNI